MSDQAGKENLPQTEGSEEPETPTGMDPTWDEMKAKGTPLNATTYLNSAYAGIPKSLSAEEIQNMPAEIRADVEFLVSRTDDLTEGDEEPDTPTGTNPVWEYMQRKGLPMTASEFLKQNLGDDPSAWKMGPEQLQEVPEQIRPEVERLMSHSPGASTDQPLPDLQNLPVDPAEIAISAGLEAHGRKRPH